MKWLINWLKTIFRRGASQQQAEQPNGQDGGDPHDTPTTPAPEPNYTTVGQMQFRRNETFQPSGLNNGDTWTVKERSSDGRGKCSPDPRVCAKLQAAGRKDHEYEMSFWNPDTVSEYLPRSQRVAQDNEVPGRVKWNYRRATGFDDLPIGTVCALVRIGLQAVNGKLDCERFLKLDRVAGQGDPQRRDDNGGAS